MKDGAMQSRSYSLHQYSIEILLNWIKSGEIAIPEIQRPFVWSANKVRDFIDSLYYGYPVGYLITWPKSGVPIRDGSSSTRERILIDGQQRMMALRTALLGETVFDKKYKEKQIQIAFHPDKESFAVSTTSIQRDSGWIPDISTVFNSSTSLHRLIDSYCEANDGVDKERMAIRIEQLYGIRNNSMGVVELNADLGVETIVEIFVRINQTGVRLSSADFIMSKMAASEQYKGHLFRQSIDCFCHLATVPEAYNSLASDPAFASTDYFQNMKWLKDWSNGLYVPTYTDILRVVYGSEFKRGDLNNLVNLLSGDSAKDTFLQLENGIQNYINETNFKRFITILRSAGFVDASMITARNAVNSAYVLFLTLRGQKVNPNQIEKLVRRWFVMSVLTGRYSGEPQSTLGEDIRGMTAKDGAEAYLDKLEQTGLSKAFWEVELLQKLNVSGPRNVYYNVFLASQVRANDKGFLSRDMTARDLFGGQKDIHHIFPQNHLQGDEGIEKNLYNQLANLVVMQKEINIAIGDTAPTKYFLDLQTGCRDGKPPYGVGIDNIDELQANLNAHCIPHTDDPTIFENYEGFLEKRRELMADKIRKYYESL